MLLRADPRKQPVREVDHIIPALPERSQLDADPRNPLEQVLAEAPVPYQLVHVRIGKHGLGGVRELAYLLEHHGAPSRQFEHPGPEPWPTSFDRRTEQQLCD
jgi:hypothetical protein